MSSPELSVVCKSCGAEVSPYVTECPYCGTRLRKRAPKLERVGDELTAKETRRARRARRRQQAASRRASRALAGERPWVTIVAVLVPAVLVVVERAGGLTPDDVGALFGPVGSEWWRYLTAPWVFDDVGYLFVVAVALALFVPGLERRLGIVPTAILLVAAGSLGMLAADGLETALGEGALVAAGGNGVALGALCAWWVIRRDEATSLADDSLDWIGVAVAAAVLVLLPVVDDWANFSAGIAGGVVGTVAGLSATSFGRGSGGGD
jgi:membrane associated rhomboid family serine protease